MASGEHRIARLDEPAEDAAHVDAVAVALQEGDLAELRVRADGEPGAALDRARPLERAQPLNDPPRSRCDDDDLALGVGGGERERRVCA